MRQERCEFCNGVIERITTRVPFHYKKEVIYVDHVPVRMCRKCGEVYYEAKVYKRLEEIAARRRTIKAKITFPLADYRLAQALGT
ncbi:MAG: YgiT-type zinc finger protein [Acidobacteria bacterium]|nr:YgiT-type zinc finger protein [Acidobacteriota bacterium]